MLLDESPAKQLQLFPLSLIGQPDRPLGGIEAANS
jgi:hypothetical protein